MSKQLGWLQEEIQALKEGGLYTEIRTVSSPQGPWLVIEGKNVLNFCSNNYLGLANHPLLVLAAQEAMARFGIGPAAVRSIAGTMDLHLELERRRLAAFKGVESAITFQSGFTANLATIPAMAGKDDAVFSDELNHASIIDGCRLSGAKIIRYAHADPTDLERVLKENRAQFPRAMVITDGVFKKPGPVMKYHICLPTGDVSGTLGSLEMKKFPLGVVENGLPLKVKAVFEPERGFDVGAGKGNKLETEITGGVVGIILDGRGRPFDLSELTEDERVNNLKRWMTELDIYPAEKM